MNKSEFLASVLSGLIATVAYVILSSVYRTLIDQSRFRYLKSNKDEFDWICYNMDKENGRKISNPNGSIVRITSSKGKVLNIRLMHPDSKSSEIRQWRGQLTMNTDSIGVITLKYDDGLEFHVRQVFVGTSDDENYDYIFYKGDGKDYGSELIKRDTRLRPAPKLV